MTHPTAYTIATAIARNPGSPLMIDWHGCKYLPGKMAAHRVSIRSESAFRNSAANCLELRHADFHYSVIGRLLVHGYADCRSLNVEVPASRSEVTGPDVPASGGDKTTLQPIEPALASNRWKKD
jgi:hypothetical protein